MNLTIERRTRNVIVMKAVALTFLGPPPEGKVPYHKNGVQSDNFVNNIEYIDRHTLGKKTGAMARRKPVAKINSNGEIVEVYRSARECAKANYMSYQSIISRCNRKCKSAFAPDGYAYAWDDSEISMRYAIRQIELDAGYMPKAPDVEFMW